MKKIGIIGGIGWPSTIEYYRHICELKLLSITVIFANSVWRTTPT
jgi:aspartate/glutamate racemase